MDLFAPVRVTMVALLMAIWSCPASAGHPAQPAPMDPNNLSDDQKDLLNYAYLTLRMDLLPAIKTTGDQELVVRHARVGVIYQATLTRTPGGEVELHGGRGGGPGMVKFVLQSLEPVREVLSLEQRQAFAQLMLDQKLQPLTIDATSGHFIYRYTFAPGDRVEKARAKDGRILDVVVPEKEDFKQWHAVLQTGEEVIKVLDQREVTIRRAAIDWLLNRGPGSLDASTKKRIAELILTQVERADPGVDPGWWMQGYSTVGRPEHEPRVWAVVEKSGIHHVAGVVAGYASVAPAKAVEYAAKPTADQHFKIRAVQGLGMAPDGLRLLQLAKAKMPDMKWKIDEEIRNIQARDRARAEGKPVNPGQAELEARRKAEKEAAEKAREGKKPGDYLGYDDWFADLASDDRDRYRKASYHFVNSVYAVDLSTVTPQQRAAVFKIALAAVTAPKTTIDRHQAGMLLIASADRKDTDALLALIQPDNGLSHYPLAAVMRINPDRAEQVILGMEGRTFSKVRDAVRLAPAVGIPVLEKASPRFQSDGTRDWIRHILAELKTPDGSP